MDARIFICALITAVCGSILAAPARAQDEDRIEEILPPKVGIFEFQSITIQEFMGMLKVMGVRTNMGESIGGKHYIRFGSAEELARARDILARIDVPSKDIALHVQLVLATDNTIDALNLPDDDGIRGQLRELFKFPRYYILSSSYLVAKSGQLVESYLEGVPRLTDEQPNETRHLYEPQHKVEVFKVYVEPAFIDEGPGVIRVHNFSITRTAPEPARRLLKTTLNIKNGNTIIVGGSNIDERTYVVIVRAEVME